MPLLATLFLLLASCGGSDSGPDKTVRAYFDAIVVHDGQRACDQLTNALRADIEHAPAARSAGRSCADVMNLAAGLNPQLSAEDIKDLQIEIREDGDRAAATLENPLSRRKETIHLVHGSGEWKISTLQTRPKG
jgi:hypothetical protein